MSDSFRNQVIKKLENGNFDCTKEFTVSMFSGRHKLMILWILLNEGPQSFSDFLKRLTAISKKVLSNQLKELMEDQLVARSEEMVGNVRHTSYRLTAIGQSLAPVLNALNDWGQERLAQSDVQSRFNQG
ncbi:helix-turn-helix domain-containing protein [Leuconostocaceae bacterium ESL0958]|nr:helix-turn-helix domain-containing protein [Leuconostocaceae bacterium ESL0958]